MTRPRCGEPVIKHSHQPPTPMNTPTPPTSSHFSTIYHIATLTTALFFLISPTLAQEASFQGIGFLPNGDLSRAGHVSSDGSVVLGRAKHDDGSLRAIRWEDGNLVALEGLGIPSQDYSIGISDDGSTIVGHSSTPEIGPAAVRWRNGEIEILDFPGHPEQATYALGVSSDGSVIVGTGSASGFPNGVGVRWEDGEIELLGTLGGDPVYSQAFGVSSDGSVIIGPTSSDNGHECYRWENGEMGGLGDLQIGRAHV